MSYLVRKTTFSGGYRLVREEILPERHDNMVDALNAAHEVRERGTTVYGETVKVTIIDNHPLVRPRWLVKTKSDEILETMRERKKEKKG